MFYRKALINFQKLLCYYVPISNFVEIVSSQIATHLLLVMYNHTKQWWLESTYSAVGEENVLFSRNAKPGMFGLGIVNLAYFTQFIFLIKRLVPGKMVMVAIVMYSKSPRHRGLDIWKCLKICFTFHFLVYLFVCLIILVS